MQISQKLIDSLREFVRGYVEDKKPSNLLSVPFNIFNEVVIEDKGDSSSTTLLFFLPLFTIVAFRL